MNSFIDQLDLYFGKKAPQLPAGFKEFIVKFSPYIIIIGIVFTGISLLALIPLLLGVGMIGAALGAATYGSGYVGLLASVATSVIAGVLYIIALPGLFKRTPASWKYLFYAELVSLLGSLISMQFVSLVIGALIGFYVLFQIRSYYNGVIPAESMTPPTPPAAPSTPPVPPAAPTPTV